MREPLRRIFGLFSTGLALWPLSSIRAAPLVVPITPTAQVVIPGTKYPRPTLAQMATNRALAFQYAERTQRTIVGTLHLVETEHFLIFSAWNPSSDPLLADVVERMYAMLSQQFAVSSNELPWAGKCPIFVFWEPHDYDRFIAEVDKSRELDANMSHANGYHASKGNFEYVVINGVAGFGTNLELAKIRFYHVLVHEGTHAFLHRYVSEHPLPLWVEEGIADFVAATLVPNSEANRTYVTASQEAVKKPEMLSRVMEKKQDFTPTEYGISQSLVRFLVGQNQRAMMQFVELLKRGRSEPVALSEAYHGTDEELKRAWLAAWQRGFPPSTKSPKRAR